MTRNPKTRCVSDNAVSNILISLLTEGFTPFSGSATLFPGIGLLLWAKEGGRELSPEAPVEKAEAAPEPRPLKVKKKKADDEVAPKKVTKKVVKKAAEPEAPAPAAEKPAKVEKA